MAEDRIAKRARLIELLDAYESGRVIHLDEDERGFLERDTTADRIVRLQERIAEIDEQINQDAKNA